MPISVNGNGTITGVTVGGLPDGIVDTDMLAANAVSSAKLASGVGGKILQHKYVDNGAHLSTSATSTYPELSSDLRLTITPNASNNIIVIKYLLSLGMSSANVATIRICKDVSNYSDAADSEMVNPPNTIDSDNDGSGVVYGSYTNGWMHQALFMSIETAGNTTQRVYSIHAHVSGGTLHVNRWSTAAYYRRSYAEIYEVAA